jgi:paraquat-inducible protein B
MNINVGEIMLFAAAATGFAKPLVDLIKKSPIPTPAWSLPMLAVGLGIVICFLLSLAMGQEITMQVIGADILAGIVAGVGAVGVTELHKSANSQTDLKEDRDVRNPN